MMIQTTETNKSIQQACFRFASPRVAVAVAIRVAATIRVVVPVVATRRTLPTGPPVSA